MGEANSDSQILEPGAELPEGYHVEEILAQGRLGAAYVVRSADGERRAANVIHLEHEGEVWDWFRESSKLRQELVHPHLAHTHATGRLADGRPVEITELLEGESLREAVINRSAPLPIPVVARILREVASALDHLHQHVPPVVHRALTPENVLLTAPDGLVKLLGVGEADRPHFGNVRPWYQPPETLSEISSVTPGADVFVLAAIAYEALTGRAAFTGTADEVLGAMHAGSHPRVSALRAEVPAAVDEVLARCWELSPERRPASAGEAARAISAALGVVDTGEVLAPENNASNAPLRVIHRRNALLGPTVETAAPAMDPRSFLAREEHTEVSSPAVAMRPSEPPRPSARPLPSDRPTMRGGGGVTRPNAAVRVSRPLPLPTPLVDEPPAQASDDATSDSPVAVDADVGAPTSEPAERPPEAPTSDGSASPFAGDARSTLQLAAVVPPQEPLVQEEPTPRVDTPAQPPVRALHTSAEPSGQPVAAAQPEEAPATLPLLSQPAPIAQPAPATMPFASQPTPAVLPSQPPQASAPPQQRQPIQSPFPPPTSSLPPVSSQPPPRRTGSQRAARSPEELAFPDEPTGAIVVKPEASPWRSPWVIASIFLANAAVIVGIAHAIALAASREPVVRIIQAPAAVCAPCTACAACPVCAPTVQQLAPPAPRPPRPATPGLIRRVPVFGAPPPVRR